MGRDGLMRPSVRAVPLARVCDDVIHVSCTCVNFRAALSESAQLEVRVLAIAIDILIDRPHLSNYVVHGVIMDMCDLLFSWLLYLIVCY